MLVFLGPILRPPIFGEKVVPTLVRLDFKGYCLLAIDGLFDWVLWDTNFAELFPGEEGLMIFSLPGFITIVYAS